MRCADVARELAMPAAGGDAAELRRHLAGCPRCAAAAEAARRLDRLWAATRPEEPAAAAWGRLWARVGRAAEPPRPRAIRPGSSGVAWAVAAGVQAAAALLAAWLVLGRAPTQPAGAPAPTPSAMVPAEPQAPPLRLEFELDEGQTLFLVLDEGRDRVVVTPRTIDAADLVAFDGETPDPYAAVFQADLLMLNAMEGLK